MKTPLYFLVVLGLTLFITGCGCLEPPNNDSASPKTIVTVIYDDESGQKVSKSVNSNHVRNLSVEIPVGSAFQVVYMGEDEGGVQSIHIEDGVTSDTGEVLSFEEITDGVADFSSCARPSQTVTAYYEWQEDMQEYNFRAKSVDFNQNESYTPVLTVTYSN